MKKLSSTVLAIAIVLLANATTRYITQTGAGLKDGSSWANAGDSSMVQSFINSSVTNDQVWIAQGTYYPTSYPPTCAGCVNNRDYTFYLKSGGIVYGGFDGTEVSLSDRDTILPTVFSGAINTSSDTDNVYHVVMSVSANSSSILNGITVKYGYAGSSTTITVSSGAVSVGRGVGGGMFCNNSSMRIVKCNFSLNTAYTGGGISDYSSHHVIDTSLFTGNKTLFNGGGGGALNIDVSSGNTITGCRFSGNMASSSGGGAINVQGGGGCNIRNCAFISNSTTSAGGAITINTSGGVSITNSLFYYNNASSIASAIYCNGFSTADINSCTIYGGTAGTNAAALRAGTNSTVYIRNTVIWNFDPIGGTVPFSAGSGATITSSNNFLQYSSADPLFINTSDMDGSDNILFTADDGFSLSCNSPCRNTASSNFPFYDITGIARGTQTDAGAYEIKGAVTITQSPDTICNVDSVWLKASASYNFQNATYAWKINNTIIPAQLNDSIKILGTAGQSVSFIAHNTCGSTDSIITNYNLQGTSATPNINISVFPDNFVCAGTPIYLTASTITNGGTNPSFQWYVNHQPIGGNNDTFVPVSYNNSDTFTCIMTTSLACVTKQTDTSGIVRMIVTPVKRKYVKPGGTGNGSSWLTAMGNLNAALDSVYGSCNEIWVAAGTYKPDRYPASGSNTCGGCITNRHFAFDVTNVALYGGFNGTETSLSQRNIAANPTNLSGDIGTAAVTDNCYHVVVCLYQNYQSIIDGFIIRDGNANIYPQNTNTSLYSQNVYGDRGAGVYCADNTITSIRNCTFLNDSAKQAAGMYAEDADVQLTNCVFNSNKANSSAGAFNIRSSAKYNNCVFYNNSNVGLYTSDCPNTQINNCLFIKNTSYGFSTSTPNSFTITNSTFFKNTYGISASVSGSSSIKNSIIITNLGGSTGQSVSTGAAVSYCLLDTTYVGTGNFKANPLFIDTLDFDGPDNIWMTADDGLSLQCNSPAIDTGIITTLSTDITGAARIGKPDLGAYEVPGSSTLPSLLITANADTICANSTLTFTATPSVGGTTPAFQWKKNGNNIATGATYSSSSLANGDQITCVLTSNANCITTTTATSNTITVHVIPSPTPPTITPNGATTFCSGGSVTLNATGGSSFVWSNGATTSSITVNTNGTYTVSNLAGANGCAATSTPVTVTVNPLPNATITPSGSTTLCTGQSVTLSVPTGNSYLWSTSETTSSITVTQQGNYKVTVTTANNCSAVSTTTTVTVNASVTPTVTASANKTTICQGETVTFTAVQTNGGANPSYIWYRNGNSTGSSANPYSTSSISNGDAFTVKLTSNALCANPTQVTSSPVSITVITVTTPVISQNGNTLTSNSASGNQWYFNGNPISGAIGQSYTATQTGNYTVKATDANSCVSLQSNSVYVNITGIEDLTLESISVYPNPATSQLFIETNGIPVIEINIYNTTGSLVSQTKQMQTKSIDITQLAAGVYIAEIKTKAGSVKRRWLKM